MSLKISSGKLSRATRDLLHVWQQTRSVWRDARAQGFDQKYITLIQACVRSAHSTMDHMDSLLAQAHRDCE